MENSTESNLQLHKRSDGWSETESGDVAVVMIIKGAKTLDGANRFEYRYSFATQPIGVEWGEDDIVSLYPQEVANGLIHKDAARMPIDSEIEAHNAALEAPQEPVTAPTVAEVPEPSTEEPDAPQEPVVKEPAKEPVVEEPAKEPAKEPVAPAKKPKPKAPAKPKA